MGKFRQHRQPRQSRHVQNAVAQVVRYATATNRSSRTSLLTGLARQFGPIGQAIAELASVFSAGSTPNVLDIQEAIKMIQGAGYDVSPSADVTSPPTPPPVITPPPTRRRPSSRPEPEPSSPRGPAQPPSPPPPPGSSPGGPGGSGPGDRGRRGGGFRVPSVPTVPAAGSLTSRRTAPDEPPLPDEDHPFNREILTPQSSNVFSFTYDYQSSTLYVTYKASQLSSKHTKTVKGRGGLSQLSGVAGKTITGKTNARGPMYAYYDVPERVFTQMKFAHSKGKFVWDRLRVRGTIHGHKYRFGLIQGSVTIQDGVIGTYIPRRATSKGFRVRSVAVVGSGKRAFQTSTLPERLRNG